MSHPKPSPAEVRQRRGRVITIQPGIKTWSRQRKRYLKLKAEIVQMLGARGWDKARVQEWLTSPAIGLKGRAPKQLMNPRSIGVLHEWCKKVLT